MFARLADNGSLGIWWLSIRHFVGQSCWLALLTTEFWVIWRPSMGHFVVSVAQCWSHCSFAPTFWLFRLFTPTFWLFRLKQHWWGSSAPIVMTTVIVYSKVKQHRWISFAPNYWSHCLFAKWPKSSIINSKELFKYPLSRGAKICS